MNKKFDWDEKKNKQLKNGRGISFEQTREAIENRKNLLDIIVHPNPKKYPKQKVYVVKIQNYVYMVPFIEDKNSYFLKTIYPSRKMTKKYITERRSKNEKV